MAGSPAELRDLLDELRLSSYDATVVLESMVPGGDEALRGVACFCDGTGELRSWSTGRVLAEDPLGAGEGAWDCVLLDRDDELAAQASKLLKSVGYRGFAHLDARFDARDGSYQFLRIDPHPGRGAFAMNIGGADIARLLVDEYVLGRTGPAQVACNPGIFTVVPRYVVRRSVQNKLLRRRAIARLLVDEYVLGRTGPAQVACNPGIFTVVPRYVVRRSVQNKLLRRRALSLFDQGKAKNPLFYHADTLTHGFWARLTYLEQIRAFRRRAADAEHADGLSGERF